MKKEIEVVVDEQGEVALNPIGFAGRNCREATRFIEAALGMVKTRRDKAECTRHISVCSRAEVRA